MDSPANDTQNQRRLVEISINGIKHQITRGRHSVAEIKKLGSVPLADDLEEVVQGQLKPLPDDGYVEIRGEEMFVSHPKSGSSS